MAQATTPTGAVDVTAVLDSKLAQVFTRARTLQAEVMPDSKLMEHPLENGATVVDHRVLLPVSAQLSMILSTEDFPAVYGQVRDFFTRGELLTLQTRVGSWPSMVIERMPHMESPDVADGVQLALTLREVQFAETRFTQIKVARPKDSDTKARGQQQPKEAPPQQSRSVLSRIFK